MTRADGTTLTGVSETALLTLAARAHEARRAERIIDDPMAITLMDSIDYDFTKFGFRGDLTERALPMYTYQVLSRIPDFIPLFGTLLGGIYWITHRREDVAEAERNEKKGGEQ